MLFIKKFGGSSLKSIQDIESIANKIKDEFVEKNKYLIVTSAIAGVTDKLIELSGQISNDYPRELDSLLPCGEIISTSLLTMALNKLNLKAISLNAYQIELATDENYGHAKILSVNKNIIDSYLQKYDILVICGFQGITKKCNFSTLGRNGSDITAVYLSTIYNVPCYLYKDTALSVIDPHFYQKVKRIPNISYDQMRIIIEAGSKIIPIEAIDLAKRQQIPIIIENINTKETSTINNILNNDIDVLGIIPFESYEITILHHLDNNIKIVEAINNLFEVDNLKINDFKIYFSTLDKNIEQKSKDLLKVYPSISLIVDDVILFKVVLNNGTNFIINPHNNLDKVLETIMELKLC